jgi:hypothetical protein
MHVERMVVRQNAGRVRREDDRGPDALREPANGVGRMAGAAARLDDDARRSPDDVGGLPERVGVARRDRRNRETFRQGFKIEVIDELGLDVDWQAQTERTSEIGLCTVCVPRRSASRNASGVCRT